MKKSKILILTTGGGITSDVSKNGLVVYINKLKGKEFLKKYFVQSLPELEKKAEIEVKELSNMHSSAITQDDRIRYATELHKVLFKYDGFIITHGTDTLAYSAAAFCFFFQNPPKPIVFVSSCVPLHCKTSQARQDLLDAVTLISSAKIKNVVVINNGKILQASRINNTQEYGKDIFVTKDSAILGYIQGDKVNLVRPGKNQQKAFVFQPSLEKKVLAQLIYPGYPSELLTKLFLTNRPKGVVLVSYGSGCFPLEGENSLKKEIINLIKNKVFVVASSSSILGEVWLSKNKPYKNLIDLGVISALDMTYPAAIVKLMWVLSLTQDLSEVKKMMHTTFCEELTRNYSLIP